VITSKDIIEKTGISRATLNNYIRMGLLPRPLVKGAESEDETARRIGYFPDSVLGDIERIQRLKREGASMEEIARQWSDVRPIRPLETEKRRREDGPDLEPVPARKEEPPVEAGQLKLTIEDIKIPAYLINPNYQVEWINPEAEEQVFNTRLSKVVNLEARNIFKVFFNWEFHEHLENWKDLVAFHLGVLKAKFPDLAIDRLYEGMGDREIQLLEELDVEAVDRPDQQFNSRPLTLVGRDGSRFIFQIYAMFFREGVFFTYVPVGEEAPDVMEFLSCRRTVINELLKRRMPALVNLCVLVADLQDSVKICAELMPGEYFELINGLWRTVSELFEKYNGISGKHAGDGVLYYFIQKPGTNYLMDAMNCALEVREQISRFSHEWRLRKGWLNDLYLNIGLNEGQEFFGTIRSSASIEFTALGDSINYAGRLSDLARFGAIWTTKGLINKLDQEEQERIRFGVHRREGDREIFIENSFIRVSDLLRGQDKPLGKFQDIATLPITEIMGWHN